VALILIPFIMANRVQATIMYVSLHSKRDECIKLSTTHISNKSSVNPMQGTSLSLEGEVALP